MLAIILVIGVLASSGVEGSSELRAHGRSLLEVKEALIGYQQGVVLGLAPGNGGECVVSGVPTPAGFSPPTASPLLLSTPKGTGVHTVTFAPPADNTVTVAVIAAPPSNSYSAGSDPANPLIAFDASLASEGESGVAIVALYAGGNFVCSSTISFTVIAPLGCAPSAPGGSVIPSNPGGIVYVNQQISTTIIQQIVVVNNVNIVNINNAISITQNQCVCCYNSCNNNYYLTYYFPQGPSQALPPGIPTPAPGNRTSPPPPTNTTGPPPPPRNTTGPPPPINPTGPPPPPRNTTGPPPPTNTTGPPPPPRNTTGPPPPTSGARASPPPASGGSQTPPPPTQSG